MLNAIASSIATFILSVVITYLLKRILIWRNQGPSREELDRRLPVLKVSLLYAGIVLVLQLCGLDLHWLLTFQGSAVLVADLVLVYVCK